MAKGKGCCTSIQLTRGTSLYSLYVLILVLLAYLLNQLDRYTLAIVTKPLAQEIHYGDQGCMKNEDDFNAEPGSIHCSKVQTEYECSESFYRNGTFVCKWDYTGQGFDYQILAGPIFILIYTLAGVPIGILADSYNRKILLGISVIFWSICTSLSGLVSSYWELVLLRFGLGLGQAGCNPFATSLIADYFAENLRGAALGVYNWGIYTGYSLSFAFGNFVTQANINGQGWRWTFVLAGLPGVILGLLIIFTVREPQRSTTGSVQMESLKPVHSTCGKLQKICTSFCRPSVLLLCLAGSIRNAAGYVWAYNTQVYFEEIGQSRSQIGFYMSWIPLAGSIGVVLGGFISDRFVRRTGPHDRIWVLIISQMLAAPFAAGSLLLPPPWAYFSLIPMYIIGEMWVGVTLAVLVELIPTEIRTGGVAAYFFVISNFGGNMPLMVPFLQGIFESLGCLSIDSLRYSLLMLYPGEYVLASALFLLIMFVLQRDIAYIKALENQPRFKPNSDEATESNIELKFSDKTINQTKV